MIYLNFIDFLVNILVKIYNDVDFIVRFIMFICLII